MGRQAARSRRLRQDAAPCLPGHQGGRPERHGDQRRALADGHVERASRGPTTGIWRPCTSRWATTATATLTCLGRTAPATRALPRRDPAVVAADPTWVAIASFCFRRVEDLRAIMVKYGDADKQIALAGVRLDQRSAAGFAVQLARGQRGDQGRLLGACLSVRQEELVALDRPDEPDLHLRPGLDAGKRAVLVGHQRPRLARVQATSGIHRAEGMPK